MAHLYSLEFLPFIALLGVAMLIGLAIERYLRKKTTKVNFLLIILPIISMGAFLLTKGITIIALKGFILSIILLLASVSDIREHKAADIYSILIIITALIGVELSDLPFMFISMVVVGLPQLIVATVSPGTYGGADIKISSTCALLLGMWKGYAAVMIGLTLSILFTFIYRISKNQSIKEGIPMIPYLSIGILSMFII